MSLVVRMVEVDAAAPFSLSNAVENWSTQRYSSLQVFPRIFLPTLKIKHFFAILAEGPLVRDVALSVGSFLP